jgi:hypothetical protein
VNGPRSQGTRNGMVRAKEKEEYVHGQRDVHGDLRGKDMGSGSSASIDISVSAIACFHPTYGDDHPGACTFTFSSSPLGVCFWIPTLDASAGWSFPTTTKSTFPGVLSSFPSDAAPPRIARASTLYIAVGSVFLVSTSDIKDAVLSGTFLTCNGAGRWTWHVSRQPRSYQPL